MKRYGLSLRIQSECGKLRTRITPNTDTFHAVTIFAESFILVSWQGSKNACDGLRTKILKSKKHSHLLLFHPITWTLRSRKSMSIWANKATQAYQWSFPLSGGLVLPFHKHSVLINTKQQFIEIVPLAEPAL